MFSPLDRSRIRSALVEEARADPRITGAALVGSAARDAEDRWSDIDLALQLDRTADEPAVVRDWTALIDERFGLADVTDVFADEVRYRVFLLHSTLQIDVSFFPHDRFRATEPAFQLLFGAANAASPPAAPDAEHAMGTGWLYALHARSALARGRLWQAVLMLDDLRNTVIALMSLREGLNPWHGRGVDALPDHDRAALAHGRATGLDALELDRSRIVLTGLLLEEIERFDAARATRLHAPFVELARTIADAGR